MSGGHFGYSQHHITEIIDSIEHELYISGKDKPKEELYNDEEYYLKYPEDLKYPILSMEVQDNFNKAVEYLKKARIYTQRIDWFLSGDDGEENFLKRLKEELNEINK